MLHVELPAPFVTVATIDRPAQRNAVDHAVLTQLGDAIDESVGRHDRVFVLTGAGGVFSAGADLRGLGHAEFTNVLRGVLRRLATAPIVTLANVDGAALGAGMQLASFCDLRVASERARFGIPAAKLGLAIDELTIARVVELCGGAVARTMLFGGEPLDANDALRLGFAARLGSLADSLEWATTMAALAPLSAIAHKATLASLAQLGDRAAAAEASAVAWASADAAEGRAAFLERRPAQFHGR